MGLRWPSAAVPTSASGTVLAGGPVHDTATIAGGFNPTGTVTFRLYGPDDSSCTGTVAFTSVVPVAGNGRYDSTSFTTSAPGTYRWTAAYSGDGANEPAASACNAPGESGPVLPFAAPPYTRVLTGDVTGPVVVSPGESVLITAARVVGPVTVNPGGALTVVNSQITSGIVATSPSFFSLCASQVAAPTGGGPAVTVSGAAVPIRIGDPATGCATNRIGGSVSLTGNTGGVTLGSNIVSGNASVSDNMVGAVVVKANTVFATLTCTGNNPPPTNAGQPNTAGAKVGQCT